MLFLPIEFPTSDIHEDAATSKLRACERKSSTDGKQVGSFSERAKSESSYAWPGSSIFRNSENSAASPASNRPILSPSSSIGSLSSEKSTLNPNAKVFIPPRLDYYLIFPPFYSQVFTNDL